VARGRGTARDAEEAVTIIAELFAGEQLTYHGPHYQVQTARLYSVPAVPPPIYVSGFGRSPRSWPRGSPTGISAWARRPT
jgi:alkanesulfonate monooxygenase SsuD/methylene tetrahydromethanopterin reductase-like flavin-dependent oxidoreductase (luciferase family)